MSAVLEISSASVQNALGRVSATISALNEKYPERGEVIDMLLAAAIARQNVALIGPPGVAKSKLTRDFLENMFPGEKGFVWLMDRFTKPTDIMGPPDISALSEKPPRLVTSTRGKLPEAVWAFIDEFARAGGGTLNALLTVLNEREFDNGEERIKVPLRMLVGAANDIPSSREMEAFWDRFSVRVIVSPMRGYDDWSNIIMGHSVEVPPVNLGDIEILRAAADDIEASVASEIMWAIRREINAARNGRGPSDRRYSQAVQLCRAVALMEGRSKVRPDDTLVLSNVLWDTEDQIDETSRVVSKHAVPDVTEVRTIIDSLERHVDNHEGASFSHAEDVRIALEAAISAFRKLMEDNPLLAKTNLAQQAQERIDKVSSNHHAMLAELTRSAVGV